MPLPDGSEGITGLSSYPPLIPIAKTYLAAIAGEWSEPLVNTVHLLWFLATLVILYYAVRRHASRWWSLIGVYALTSIPLYLIHGTNPYADVAVSVHVLAATSLLYHAAVATDPTQIRSFLRLALPFFALLPFTKNEALLMHLPVLSIAYLGVLTWHVPGRILTKNNAIQSGATFIALLALTALPWMIFKWSNGLLFGNAQSISNLSWGYQNLPVIAIWVHTFFEGNWLLFPFLLILLLLWQWKAVLRSPLLLLFFFTGTVYVGQVVIYTFTSLSAEAIYQTGYGRGVVQLLPVMVMGVVLLLKEKIAK
jgi:hypothetical protein